MAKRWTTFCQRDVLSPMWLNKKTKNVGSVLGFVGNSVPVFCSLFVQTAALDWQLECVARRWFYLHMPRTVQRSPQATVLVQPVVRTAPPVVLLGHGVLVLDAEEF